jgi:tetratricopeptide (TPR) repeat protein
MLASTSFIRCRFARTPFAARWFALAGSLLSVSLAGCGGLIAQSRNAEGVQLYQQARYPEALREFQEASYAEPNGADSYYNIAATYHRMGRRDHCESDLKLAEKYYNDCFNHEPNHVEAHRGLSVLLAEQGRKDEAFQLLQRWADCQPKMADPKVELARLHDEFGNRQMARDCLIEAVEAQPDNARALTALGKIREDAGDKTQALENYQRSLASDYRQPQVVARVAALQNTGAGASPVPVEPGARMADRGATTAH